MAFINAGAKSLVFRWSGTDKMRQQLADLQAGAPIALAAAGYEEMETLIADIKEHHVPVDQGPLRGSGFVQLPVPLPGPQPGYRINAGFGGAAAPYAWSVHENPRAGQTGGVSPSGRRYKTWAKVGHWKFFEGPFQEFTKGLNQRIGKRIATIWFRKMKKS